MPPKFKPITRPTTKLLFEPTTKKRSNDIVPKEKIQYLLTGYGYSHRELACNFIGCSKYDFPFYQKVVKINDEDVDLRLYAPDSDTFRFHNVRESHLYSCAHLILICLDITENESWFAIKNSILNKIRSDASEYGQIALIITNCNDQARQKIPDSEIEKLFNEIAEEFGDRFLGNWNIPSENDNDDEKIKDLFYETAEKNLELRQQIKNNDEMQSEVNHRSKGNCTLFLKIENVNFKLQIDKEYKNESYH